MTQQMKKLRAHYGEKCVGSRGKIPLFIMSKSRLGFFKSFIPDLNYAYWVNTDIIYVESGHGTPRYRSGVACRHAKWKGMCFDCGDKLREIMQNFPNLDEEK